MKKIALLLLLITLLVIIPAGDALAQQDQSEDNWKEILGQQLEGIDYSQWEQALSKLSAGENKWMNGLSVSDWILQWASGKTQLDIGSVLQMIIGIFTGQIGQSWSILIQIVAIGLLCAILHQIKSSFASQGVSTAVYYLCYLVISALMIQNMMTLVSLTRDTIAAMVDFTSAAAPTLLVLLASIGGVSSAAALQPAFIWIINMSGALFQTVILPLILCGLVIGLANRIGKQFQLDRMERFIQKTAKWIIGIVMTVFLGILSLQGISGAVFDGVTLRTAKYAVSNIVPVAGGMVSETIETVMGCGLIIKNASGILGLLALVGICLAPICQIGSVIVLYRLCASLFQPVLDEQICACLDNMANIISLLLISLLAIAIQFFMLIAMLMAAGNIAFAMRG